MTDPCPVPDELRPALVSIANRLRSGREALVDRWRRAVVIDPTLSIGSTLPRAQLTDHIPVVLQTYECRLGLEPERPGQAPPPEPEAGGSAHGLHRWQQGYGLTEVVKELGLLNECMVDELEVLEREGAPPEVMALARRAWAEVLGVDSRASVAEYFRLQQMEAAGHERDLRAALDALRELSRQRAELLHEAAHDIRDNMNVVVSSAAALRLSPQEPPSERQLDFLRILDRNVVSLRHLLDDVLKLARLQAGKESREPATIDAALLLQELGEDLREQAHQRGLALDCSGPAPFVVRGDAGKIRRIAQNLVVNAIRYTPAGGVQVSWADGDPSDAKRWVLQVRDTGPGIRLGPQASMAAALEEATDLNEPAGAAQPPAASARVPGGNASSSAPGEGIGLSIVKRLAELLDATVEVYAEPGSGTTFRVLLPKTYDA